MRLTIFLMALAVAGFVEKAGYPLFATAIALSAIWEAAGSRAWRNLKRWWDDEWAAWARTISGDGSTTLSPKAIRAKELSRHLALWLAATILIGVAWWSFGTQAMIHLIAALISWFANDIAEVADLFDLQQLAAAAEYLNGLAGDLRGVNP